MHINTHQRAFTAKEILKQNKRKIKQTKNSQWTELLWLVAVIHPPSSSTAVKCTHKLRTLDAEMEAILYTFITATAAIKYQTTHTTKTKTEPLFRNFLEETIINFMAD